MKKFYLTLMAILFAIIFISCNKTDNGTTNPVTDLGTNPKDGNIAANPSITSISPTSAEIGDVLTITGTNFGATQGSGDIVTINGKTATVYQNWSKTQIKVLVPSGGTLGSGKLSVTIGNKKSNEVNFTRLQSSPVTIGTQTWTGYNLDVTTYRNGDAIPQVTDGTLWASLTTGAWCYYNNDASMGAIYGKLYNWYAVNDSRGLAPTGWHVPTDGEWKTLSMYLGMSQADADKSGGYFGANEGGQIKEAGTSLWVTLNVGATNSSGFTALPGGMRQNYASGNSYYSYGGSGAGFWTSTDAWARCLDNDEARIGRYHVYKQYGWSVRCVKDN